MRWWKINGNAESGTDWNTELRDPKVTYWVTRAPPAAWSVGDGVFYWRSGSDQGFVGLARIKKIVARPTAQGVVRYHLDYVTPPFGRPIDLPTLRSDPDLAPHADRWLKQVKGVNEIERDEARALARRIATVNPNASDALRAWGLLSEVHRQCVYTIVAPESLLDAYRSGHAVTETKRWVTVQRWREDAPHRDVAVLFADSRWIDEVLYWGRISELRVDDGGTHLRVDDLRWLSGHFKSEQQVAATGETLAGDHRRPYVICEAPSWLHTAKQGPVTSRSPTLDSPARTFFEGIADSAIRHRVMRRLADAIDRAHACSGQWGVTIRRKRDLGYLRLNVGITEAFVVWVDSEGHVVVNVLVAPELVPKTLHRGFRHGRPYPSANGAMLWSWTDADSAMRDLCAMEDAVESAFRAAHRPTSMHKVSHEPSVAEYIRATLGRALPPPRVVGCLDSPCANRCGRRPQRACRSHRGRGQALGSDADASSTRAFAAQRKGRQRASSARLSTL